jgi:CheY-like chemotaxis protein
MNLCVNARDAMPEGGELVLEAGNVVLDDDFLERHPGAKAGPHVRLAVTDTGAGIPPALLPKIFDPFFTTKGPGKGSGLGLATALGIVKSHGGFLSVASEVGRGARFTVYLPALPGPEAPPAGPASPPAPVGAGEWILVVDDESCILRTVRATLEEHGYRVLTAQDGAAALAAYRGHRGEIRAVLLDLMLPGLDGFAVMRALREVDPDVRILASSGLQPAGRHAEALAAGARAFLGKPYTDEQLLAALNALLLEAQSPA